MSNPKNVQQALAKEAQNYPLEAPVKILESKSELTIGIPCENSAHEKRICLTPESVGVLVNQGVSVVIQSGAGSPSNFSDRLYSEKGAKIVYDIKTVFATNVVLKLNPPTLEELSFMSNGATLLSAMQRGRMGQEYLIELNKKKITAIGFELLEDKGGLKPIIRTLSEIAANCIVSIAAELLSNSDGGNGVLFGGITGVPPIKVLILGAGTIGQSVCRIARNMGADVRVFDKDHYKLRRLKHDIGEQVYTSMIDNHTLAQEIQSADVVIGCLRSEEGQSLCVVSEDMVMSMKEGSVIIDASISQGGCFETSHVTDHTHPVFVKHGVIHYCVPNITSKVSQTSTRALSYLFTPILLQVQKFGGINEMMRQKLWFQKGVYSYRGTITNYSLAKQHDLPFKSLELLFAVDW